MNRLTEATKYLLLCTSILLTCGLIALGFLLSSQARSLANTVGENMNSLHRDMVNFDIYKYDGLTVKGSDVINFTKSHLASVSESSKGDFSIKIKTINNTTIHDNKKYIRELSNFSSIYYVKAVAEFTGKVDINNNGVITLVEFIQN